MDPVFCILLEPMNCCLKAFLKREPYPFENVVEFPSFFRAQEKSIQGITSRAEAF